MEPENGQLVKPFHVTARLVWSWSALQTARAATIEEDVLVDVGVLEQVLAGLDEVENPLDAGQAIDHRLLASVD